MYNPEQHAAYMRERYHRRTNEFKTQLGGACVVCGFKELAKLRFAYKDPAQKTMVIAKLISYSDERIQAELLKCQLVCTSCHQQKVFAENGWKAAKGTHGTVSSYRYCKCDLCRAAKNAYMLPYKKEARAKKKAEGLAPVAQQ